MSIFRAALLILLACINTSLFAEEKPLWELGIGVAAINSPEYRASNERHTFIFPFPYVNYNGKYLKAEGDTVRGLLFASDRIELNISGGGSTPGNSDEIKIRRGMPDLDPTLEIGPTLNITLASSDDDTWELQVESPVRAVISSDFKSLNTHGWIFNPHLDLEINKGWPTPGWGWGISAGPVFATRQYHDYFYSVDQQYVTPTRPAYSATGGYSGFRFTTALSKRFPNFWVGAYIRYESFENAVFNDSPLVTSKNDFSGGIAIAWIFKKSARMVEVTDRIPHPK